MQKPYGIENENSRNGNELKSTTITHQKTISIDCARKCSAQNHNIFQQRSDDSHKYAVLTSVYEFVRHIRYIGVCLYFMKTSVVVLISPNCKNFIFNDFQIAAAHTIKARK